MQISEQKISEILTSTDIVDLIESYFPLRKRGKNFIGLCPFHVEKTPSFTVSPDKQIYHCFGCHAGGNAYKFMMEYEKVSFVEAAQILAQRVGISIDYEYSVSGEAQSETEQLYEINLEVGRFYSNNLLKEDEGKEALSYLENRKIALASIRSFGLGFSSNNSTLVSYLETKKLDLNKAIELGIIGESHNGRLYDKLYGRLIFPIYSSNGRIVAFAGRILNKDAKTAKYLNSPETKIYHKGKMLYGLSHAKEEIRRENRAIIVEGYMDLISLHQNGIKNVVAVSGTAFTEEQVTLLSRYTKNVILIFDSDTAGINASIRSIEVLLKKDIDIRVVALPEGEDPDSIINSKGSNHFQGLLEGAVNFLEFQLNYYQTNNLLNDYNTSAASIREIVKLLSFINDELKRSLLIKDLASKFNIRENLLESELQKIKREPLKSSLKIPAIQKPSGSLSSTENPGKVENLKTLVLEKELLQILLGGNEKANEIIVHNITEEDIKVEINRKVYEIIIEMYNNHEPVLSSALMSKIEDQQLNEYISTLSFEKHTISDKWESKNPGIPKTNLLFKAALDTIKKIKLAHLEEEIANNMRGMQNEIVTELEALTIIDQINQEKKELIERLKEENFKL